MIAKDAPLLLTRVCRMWKEVALSTPELWTKLYIPWCEARNTVEFERRWGVMQRRLGVVDEWIRKSGNLPLSLSLYYAYTPSGSEIQAPPYSAASKFQTLESSISEQLVSILANFAGRLKELDLSLPQNAFKQIDLIANTVDLPVLRTIRIRNMHSFNLFAGSYLVNLKGLQQVTLTTASKEWNPIPLAATSTMIELNLIQTPLSPTYAISILERLKSLKHCSLTISEGRTQQPQTSQPTEIAIQHLTCLKTLHIQDNTFAHTGAIKMFFASLLAPNLTWLSYRRHPYFYPNISSSINAPRVQFEPLSLIQTCNLEKLSFEQYTLGSSAFEDILRASPSISQLDIGYPPGEAGFADRGGLQDLDDLDTITPLIYSTEQRWDNKKPCLPNLKRFEGWCPNKITDEAILRFIISRLSLDNPISNLKSVKIYFLRSMQEDIAPRVLEHAEKLGLDFKLDLSYNPILVPPERDPSSVLYGISDQNNIKNSFYPYGALFPDT